MWKKKKAVASIIIPVHDAVGFTRQCLQFLDCTLKTPSEIIIVDNASTDGTPDFLRSYRFMSNYVSDLRVIRNDENVGYARGCNQGFRQAVGDYIVFLNNDITGSRPWLEALLRCFVIDSSAGMVTPKLLYPHSNKIQYAGVYFLPNLLPHILFYQEAATTPGANVLREVPAAGGGCMVVSRKVLECVGLFDENYINGLEDIDLSLRIRQKGLKNLYCPRSVLYHYESMTKGRADHSEANIRYYLQKWGAKMVVRNGYALLLQ